MDRVVLAGLHLHRHSRLLLALGLGSCLALGTLLAAGAAHQALAGPGPTYIPLCVSPGGAGGCYSSIQQAIDLASPGMRIEVAAGTYTEHVRMKGGVSVYGAGWDKTVINGNYTGPTSTVSFSSVSAGTVLSGCKITGGGNGTIASGRGGGIAVWWASPTVINTWVDSCWAELGGGVYVADGSPTFINVPVWNCHAQYGGGYYAHSGQVTIQGNPLEGTNGTVWWNQASQDGGGIFARTAITVTGMRIWFNSAASGGGVFVDSTPQRVSLRLNDFWLNTAGRGGGIGAFAATNLDIMYNIIRQNTASNSGGGAAFGQCAGEFRTNWLAGNRATGGGGGGVSVWTTSTGPTVAGNRIESNSALMGGGVDLETDAAPRVDANLLFSNTANIGAGIYFHQSGAAMVVNNIVVRNVVSTPAATGGGVAIIRSPGRLINNTIAHNQGDGVYFSAANHGAIVNNILDENTGYAIRQDPLTTTIDCAIDYNDVYAPYGDTYGDVSPGPHDMAVNPQFTASGDFAAFYHILPTSPVSLTGSLAWAPTLDFDGERRLSDGKVAMGADEIPGPVHQVYLPLVLR